MVGNSGLLYHCINNNDRNYLPSFVLWGPPGTGKVRGKERREKREVVSEMESEETVSYDSLQH